MKRRLCAVVSKSQWWVGSAVSQPISLDLYIGQVLVSPDCLMKICDKVQHPFVVGVGGSGNGMRLFTINILTTAPLSSRISTEGGINTGHRQPTNIITVKFVKRNIEMDVIQRLGKLKSSARYFQTQGIPIYFHIIRINHHSLLAQKPASTNPANHQSVPLILVFPKKSPE